MIVVDLPPFAPDVKDPPGRQQSSRTRAQDAKLSPPSRHDNKTSVSSAASSSIVATLTSSGRRSAPRVLVSQSQVLKVNPHEHTTSAILSDPPASDPRAIEYEVPPAAAIPSFGRMSKDASRDLGRLYEAVAGARRITVICGAGVSVSAPANIPDFRSSTGLFKKLKDRYPSAGLTSGKDLFDARLFNSDKTAALFHTMIAELKFMANDAEPTAFHHLLKRLDSEGRLLRVYTQNIDGLEEKAGLTFGLGETGDRTSTSRALGKRKRNPGQQRAKWSRNQSDSALLLNSAAPAEGSDGDHTPPPPMFPRVIPLHGVLSTLTCHSCSYKLVLPTSNISQPPLSLSVSQMIVEEDSLSDASTNPSLVDDEVPTTPQRAMELLQAGEPVPCPNCFEANRARVVAGMRARGVGRMKVDVVLYGGANEGAERVGQCLERDMLGLRDPHETPVPESAAETRARQRKEDKIRKAEADVEREKGSVQDMLHLIDQEGDDVLAALFEEDDELAPPATAPQQSVSSAETSKPTRQGPRPRASRLKPLPPDLLIVAGTSLKVPGTKRIVREFAKATKARDFRVYPSDDESESSSGLRRKINSRSASVSTGDGDDIQDSEEDDPTMPIRSVLLNFDFPVPSREWDDVFDIWIRGDLQRTACGLWPAEASPIKHTGTPGPFDLGNVMTSSWQCHQDALEETRLLQKKEKRRNGATNLSQTGSRINSKSPAFASSAPSATTDSRIKGAKKGSTKVDPKKSSTSTASACASLTGAEVGKSKASNGQRILTEPSDRGVKRNEMLSETAADLVVCIPRPSSRDLSLSPDNDLAPDSPSCAADANVTAGKAFDTTLPAFNGSFSARAGKGKRQGVLTGSRGAFSSVKSVRPKTEGKKGG